MFINGVSVVTTLVGGVPYGMSIAWATQVEAEHLVISLPRNSVPTERVLTAGCFTVNILAASQKDLAVRFGSSERLENKFDGVDYAVRGDAVVIADCCRALFCELKSAQELGDQLVVVGLVRREELGSGGTYPLIYEKRDYFPG
jgi:flavin reductase (DIM6/NTAB) family NADH-FMN oxidoreductase RutF